MSRLTRFARHRTRMWRLGRGLAASGILILAASSCGDEEAQLDCRQLLPSDQATYDHVVTLVVDPGPKSCGACHNTESPVSGYNFEGPAVAHDALTHKMPIIYTQVAAAKMPLAGQPWEAGDLRLLRSWYCYGAFYEDVTE